MRNGASVRGKRARETAKSRAVCVQAYDKKVTKKMSRIQGVRQQYKGMHTDTIYSTLRQIYIAPSHQSVALWANVQALLQALLKASRA